jgi:hypothetical protein
VENDYIFLFMAGAASPRSLDRRVVDGYLVGAAAGALAGMLVGGVLGRAVMLVLRLSSSGVAGIESDDGFVIGRFTAATFFLVLVTGSLGAINGAIYVALRSSLARRLRAPLWVCVSGAVGGAEIVQHDGVDFTLLDPAWFAVSSFVVLPAVAALLVVLLVERWIDRPDLRGRRAVLLSLSALAGTLGLIVAVALCAANLALVRASSSLRDRLGVLSRVAVPLLLVVGMAVTGLGLVREASAIL